MKRKIRVLVIDDSRLFHHNLRWLLANTPDIEVLDQLATSTSATQHVKRLRPDVVILNLMLKDMQGLTILQQILEETSTPVVVVGGGTREDRQQMLEALTLGAVDFLPRAPAPSVSYDMVAIRSEFIKKIKTVCATQFDVFNRLETTRDRFQAIMDALDNKQGTVETSLPPSKAETHKQLIAIAASTGGPVAIQFLLTHLPADLKAGLVIVLHIAPGFTRPLAERLNELSAITVAQAEDRQLVRPGLALIAPADKHMTITQSEAGLLVRLRDEPEDTLYRPSADILFQSIAECCAPQTCGVILTGMGNDGALGLRTIREGGGYTIAQDKSTSVVYGMPRQAVELGGVDVSLPLDRIVAEIIQVTSNTETNT